MSDSDRGAWEPWDGYVEQLRSKLPEVPSGVRDAYIQYAPWVAIVLGCLGALMWLLAVTGMSISSLLLLGGVGGATALLSGVIGLGAAALQVVGGVWMRAMRLAGWWLLALGLAITLLNRLFHLSVPGLVIACAIAYVHLRVKPAYA